MRVAMPGTSTTAGDRGGVSQAAWPHLLQQLPAVRGLLAARLGQDDGEAVGAVRTQRTLYDSSVGAGGAAGVDVVALQPAGGGE
jgi:hypothetical protein